MNRSRKFNLLFHLCVLIALLGSLGFGSFASAQIRPGDYIIIGPGGGRLLPLAVDAFRNLGQSDSPTPLGLKISQTITGVNNQAFLLEIPMNQEFPREPSSGVSSPFLIPFRIFGRLHLEA